MNNEICFSDAALSFDWEHADEILFTNFHFVERRNEVITQFRTSTRETLLDKKRRFRKRAS